MSGWGPTAGFPTASPQAAAGAPAGLPALTTSTYKPSTLTSSGWTPRITAGSGASCDLYYLAVPAGSTAPTAAQIVAGVDYGAVTALAAGSVAYTSAGTYDADSAPVTGASASTAYDQWWVAYDGSTYGTPVSGEITTAAAVIGALSVQEAGSDSAAISGAVTVQGAIAAAEAGADAAAASGAVGVAGALAASDAGSDSAAMAGAVTVAGVLAAQETGSDTAAINGGSGTFAAMAAQEGGSDSAAITAEVFVAGVLAAIEAGSDGVAIIVDVTTPPAAGTLAAQEAAGDVASFLATIPGSGASASQVWAYTLSNGKTAGECLVELLAKVDELHRIHGLQILAPLRTTTTTRSAGTIEQSLAEDGDGVTVQRLS